MKERRKSAMVCSGWTGSLQKMDSWKCCSRRCWNTSVFAGFAPECRGPHPKMCSTGGLTWQTQQDVNFNMMLWL